MDRTQRGVLVGMASALLVAVAIFILAVIFAGPGFASRVSLDFRVELLAASVLAPALSLFVCIARLAKHRFFTPADINGSALTDGTERAKLLQALLQNTLEQAALAVPVYLSCSFVCPARFLGMIPAAAAMFLAGRLAFFAGYANGAPARAFGFGFTFYPTVILGCATVSFLIMRGIS
jgi:hypothetical protein